MGITNLCLTEDGIAEMLQEIKIYHEDFTRMNDSQIGDLDKILFKCRCYCDFTGNPIKKNNIKIYSNVESLSKKYNRIFENYYKKYQNEYDKINKKKTLLTRQIFLEYQLDTKVHNNLIEVFPKIKSEILKNGSFLWIDFVDTTKNYVNDFKSDSFLKYGYVFNDKDDMHKIKFRFDSDNYRVENKSTIFSNITLF